MTETSFLPGVTLAGAVISALFLAAVLEFELRTQQPIFESAYQRAIYLLLAVVGFAAWIFLGLFGMVLPGMALNTLLLLNGMSLAVQLSWLDEMILKASQRQGGGRPGRRR